MTKTEKELLKIKQLLYQEKVKSAKLRSSIDSLRTQYKRILFSYRKQADWFYNNAHIVLIVKFWIGIKNRLRG